MYDKKSQNHSIFIFHPGGFCTCVMDVEYEVTDVVDDYTCDITFNSLKD